MNNVEQTGRPEAVENVVEVELASAGRRIGAALLNGILNVLMYVPLVAVILSTDGYNARAQGLDKLAADDSNLMVWALGCLLLILVYGIVQVYYMSRDGQSLGKKMLGIRVLKTDGNNPSFLGAVLIREVGYGLLLFAVAAGLGMLGVLAGGESLGEMLSNIVQLGASVACLVMLFRVSGDRRTLQDLLANTVVVKLPKK